MQSTTSRAALAAAVVTTILATILAAAAPAAAQTYPSRPIRIIVPFAPGGLNDNIARILQPSLQADLGQTVFVENRPGATGIVGSDTVAKTAPDGYTLLVVASSHTVAPATNAHMPYDSVHSFAPVSLLMRDPLLFIASNAVNAKTLPEFVALAKAQPGKLNYATVGTASQSHFVTELFDQRAGIKMVEIPYQGGAPAMLALISGQAQFAVLSTQLSGPQIKAGKVRALASGGRTRDAHFPDLPTLAEAGYSNIEALQWVGLLAPAKTPPEVVARLNAAVRKALADPAVMSKFDKQGVTPAASSPEEFQSLLEAEVAQWIEVGKKAGMTPK